MGSHFCQRLQTLVHPGQREMRSRAGGRRLLLWRRHRPLLLVAAGASPGQGIPYVQVLRFPEDGWSTRTNEVRQVSGGQGDKADPDERIVSMHASFATHRAAA